MSGSLARGLGGLGDAVGGTASARFSGNLEFNSGFGSTAVAYGCRAWVNFNGTGTVAIRASGNVSSITDNGDGNYTVNFTTAMPDANYCAVFARSLSDSNAPGWSVQSYLTTSVTVIAQRTTAGVNVDSLFVSVAIFR